MDKAEHPSSQIGNNEAAGSELVQLLQHQWKKEMLLAPEFILDWLQRVDSCIPFLEPMASDKNYKLAHGLCQHVQQLNEAKLPSVVVKQAVMVGLAFLRQVEFPVITPLLAWIVAQSSNTEQGIRTVTPVLIDLNSELPSPSVVGLTPQHYLEYHYHAGVVYVAHGDYAQAHICFTLCLSLPTSRVAILQTLAYGKMCCLNLVVHQKPFNLPRFFDPEITALSGTVPKAYSQLGNLFKSNQPRALEEFITHHKSVFQQAGDYDLVEMVPMALRRHVLAKLIRTCTAIPLVKLANILGYDVPEATILPNGLRKLLEKVTETENVQFRVENHPDLGLVVYLGHGTSSEDSCEDTLTALADSLAAGPQVLAQLTIAERLLPVSNTIANDVS
ncbi:COP9 signalosome complex subunit 3 [Dispira simplex]|nr:COP9 signalosome complex subunit 3 [Dispira simplex]